MNHFAGPDMILPVLYTASWRASLRARMRMSRAHQEGTVSIGCGVFQELLLAQGATLEEDEFVEVHVGGPISIRTLERIVNTGKPRRRAISRAVRAKLKNFDVTFLETLSANQAAIREVREAWHAVPSSHFMDDQEHWQSMAVREGLFSGLVWNRVSRRNVNDFLVDAVLTPAIRALPGHWGVLQGWIRPFVKSARMWQRLPESQPSAVRERSGEYGGEKAGKETTEHGAAVETRYRPPEGPVEVYLAEIWQEQLGSERVGRRQLLRARRRLPCRHPGDD